MWPLPVDNCVTGHTTPTLPLRVEWVLRSCISLRITRVILMNRTFYLRRRYGLLAMVYNWYAEPFADSERLALLFEGMHGLVFRRSIHYWQDQPGTVETGSYEATFTGHPGRIDKREHGRKSSVCVRTRPKAANAECLSAVRFHPIRSPLSPPIRLSGGTGSPCKSHGPKATRQGRSGYSSGTEVPFLRKPRKVPDHNGPIRSTPIIDGYRSKTTP